MDIETPEFLTERAQAQVKRWEPLLEGINDQYTRYVIARLLENQRAYNESHVSTADVKAFTTFTYPLIRRTYPSLIANQLVSIQPMSQPTGLAFFLDFVFKTDLAPVQAGDYLDLYNNRADPFTAYQNRINYTRGFVRGAIVGVGTGSATDFQLPRLNGPWVTRQFTPIRKNSNVAVYVDSVPQTVIFKGSPGAGEVLVDVEEGNLKFGTAPANAAVITADYDLKFEGDDSRIPELGLEMSSTSISAGSRKLKVRWSIEAQQDLMAYHGLNVEAELTAQAARELAIEIDREIIQDLVDGAVHSETWDEAWPGTGNGYDSYREYNETLMHKLIDLETKIFRARQRKPNFIVTGPDTAARLEKLNAFRVASQATDGVLRITEGPGVFGTLANRWTVIVDPLFEENKVLMGFKGSSFADTGYVYAPYIPLQATQAMMDPDDWTPRKGFMTRYGKKMIAGDLYGVLDIVNSEA